MKKIKTTVLFLWIFVLGALIAVLSMTVSSKMQKDQASDVVDDKSYYEKFEEDLKKNIKIVDTTESCAEELEEIYRDDKNVYYLPCVKSTNITIILSDGNEYPLRVALENDLVTIPELKTLGLSMYTEPIGEKNEDVTYIEIDK